MNCPIPPAPAGISELHRQMKRVSLPEISPIPFVFLRGVKMKGSALQETDMMRGEETELMGLFQGEGVYVLPGSHSKLIRVDAHGRIRDFKTMLTGELLAALAEHTILKDAVRLDEKADADALWQGLCYAREQGLNEAFFKVRILKKLMGASPAQAKGFLMGAVLKDEIASILKMDPRRIVLGGKRALREPMALLLEKCTGVPILSLSDQTVEDAVALGAVRIYEY